MPVWEIVPGGAGVMSGDFAMKKATTAITITDPLVKYQTLVSTGVYTPDLAQHRLAHHLQKLYLRLRDYSPAPEQRRRLQQIAQAVSIKTQDAALEMRSPRGLFLSGEVGTGKSMLLDLLAEGLPNHRKKRWHFTAFMLHVLSRLEQFRRKRQQLNSLEQEYSLLWMASEMMEDSPILFLDEFQLPDRAASKIMKSLFTVFFQLGGVLVASSNRMPEELEKATGIQHVPPAGPTDERTRKPALYFVPADDKNAWTRALSTALSMTAPAEHAWTPKNLVVYGRTVTVPKQQNGVAYWNFDVVTQSFGPADYISLASNFHTFVIDNVPILTLSMKNEARRFITLLDALYEARCKLLIRAAAGPDDLFFPDTRRQARRAEESSGATTEEPGDATYSETIAEVFQDQMSPFRPNIATYSDSPDSDQDSDFGAEPNTKIDFGNVGAFTGQDERP
ncbi:hypothetical protein P8C59_004135 [Phyllachora maydis]|uniref:Uncharacterized protein n=1 Tax=Phyllachora maydis TaxID=1825666 RepID=A0AAD9ME29_9PEZI|nr:hypothetical protein P8C59_004135 [Phyllachora maydis]